MMIELKRSSTTCEPKFFHLKSIEQAEMQIEIITMFQTLIIVMVPKIRMAP